MSGRERGTAAHELGHQWWYSIVGNDQYREPWLDESAASYADALVSGGFGYCRDLRSLPRRSGLRLDASMRYWIPRPDSYDRVVYGFGACTFRRLERQIGAAAMTRFLRRLVSEHRHGVMTDQDFARTLIQPAPPGFDARAFLREARAAF